MDIKSLRDLNKLMSLCRKQGIQSIKVGDIEFQLYATPPTDKQSKTTPNHQYIQPTYAPGGIEESTQILTDELTHEQLLMWSVEDTSVAENKN